MRRQIKKQGGKTLACTRSMSKKYYVVVGMIVVVFNSYSSDPVEGGYIKGSCGELRTPLLKRSIYEGIPEPLDL